MPKICIIIIAWQKHDHISAAPLLNNSLSPLAFTARSEGKVYHFRIQRSSIGAYFVSDKISFATLAELISYYQRNHRSLGVLLKEPCAQQVRSRGWRYTNVQIWHSPVHMSILSQVQVWRQTNKRVCMASTGRTCKPFSEGTLHQFIYSWAELIFIRHLHVRPADISFLWKASPDWIWKSIRRFQINHSVTVVDSTALREHSI